MRQRQIVGGLAIGNEACSLGLLQQRLRYSNRLSGATGGQQPLHCGVFGLKACSAPLLFCTGAVKQAFIHEHGKAPLLAVIGPVHGLPGIKRFLCGGGGSQ